MGLYDWVRVDIKCPHCKSEVKNLEFQTYDFGRQFNEYSIGQKQNKIVEGHCNMIAICPLCLCSIRGWLNIKECVIKDLEVFRYGVNLKEHIIIKESSKECQEDAKSVSGDEDGN